MIRLTVQEKIKAKTRTVEELLALVPDGAVICNAGTGFQGFYSKLHTIADRLTKPVVVYGYAGGKDNAYFWDDQYKEKFVTWSEFFGKPLRDRHPAGNVSLIPTHLHATNDRFLDEFPYDVLLLSTTPVNRHGYVWSGLSAPCYRAIEEAGMVVAFVNPNVPVVFGETEIPIDCIDWLVEDDSPIGTFEPAPLSETDKVIGQYVACLLYTSPSPRD